MKYRLLQLKFISFIARYMFRLLGKLPSGN